MTHSHSRCGLITTAAFGALLSGFSAVGAAADAPTVIVGYADLNVSTADGAVELYRRIRMAARHVCSSFDQPLDLNSQAFKADCISRAIANGVTAVNSPALSVVYKSN